MSPPPFKDPTYGSQVVYHRVDGLRAEKSILGDSGNPLSKQLTSTSVSDQGYPGSLQLLIIWNN